MAFSFAALSRASARFLASLMRTLYFRGKVPGGWCGRERPLRKRLRRIQPSAERSGACGLCERYVRGGDAAANRGNRGAMRRRAPVCLGICRVPTSSAWVPAAPLISAPRGRLSVGTGRGCPTAHRIPPYGCPRCRLKLRQENLLRRGSAWNCPTVPGSAAGGDGSSIRHPTCRRGGILPEPEWEPLRRGAGSERSVRSWSWRQRGAKGLNAVEEEGSELERFERCGLGGGGLWGGVRFETAGSHRRQRSGI